MFIGYSDGLFNEGNGIGADRAQNDWQVMRTESVAISVCQKISSSDQHWSDRQAVIAGERKVFVVTHVPCTCASANVATATTQITTGIDRPSFFTEVT
jgi:hypothetical protein